MMKHTFTSKPLTASHSEVIKGVRLYGKMHRFLPAVANWDGASVTEVEVMLYAPQEENSSEAQGKLVFSMLDRWERC